MLKKGGSASWYWQLLINVLRKTQQIHIQGPKSVMNTIVLSLNLLATLAQVAYSQASDPSECELILFNCPGGITDSCKLRSPFWNDRDV